MPGFTTSESIVVGLNFIKVFAIATLIMVIIIVIMVIIIVMVATTTTELVFTTIAYLS